MSRDRRPACPFATNQVQATMIIPSHENALSNQFGETKSLLQPAVDRVRPKRRYKNEPEFAQVRPLIATELQRARPARLKRTGKAFQIWTSPSDKKRRHATFPSFMDVARLYTRTLHS